ncbi:hypothetical protein L1276_004836 [Flavobacterium sp. HSC-32F16]|uniref:hypothetical protein n=1 Tax=Flavobacterium sp. HSC-32F16 TaxID=2910964 RepID=UPI0020A40BDE|nr:hypothetical protein [Flavobacterium sp. HSC-32F16]MCP2029642.1 hypothetical protein [Flavobacterium sp. HSC-32F16]
MNIREKYNITESAHYFSFQPVKPLQKISQWFLAGIITAAIVLPIFEERLGEVWFYSLYILLAYGILHSLYDIYIRARIRYTFDRRNNAIYKITPLLPDKKIMKLEEAVIFVSSEMGSWHYSLGARKSHFIKNYFISENFSSGRKSDQKQADYENYILSKLNQLIASVQSVQS